MMKLRSETQFESAFALFLTAAGVFLRLLPHPANVAPVAAVALFAGVVLRPSLALTVPLAVMIVSDFFIGHHSLYWLTWSCFALTTLIGVAISRHASPARVFAGSLAASLIFFVVSNFGVFWFERLYPRTAAGLVDCYVMALPFLRNTLIGDLLYTGAFFSVFLVAKALLPGLPAEGRN